MFTLEECATFKYWFAHWCAFNMLALNLHKWKPKYLLHDIEKPFLKLLWKDEKRVQKFHTKHSKHHPQHKPFKNLDVEAMLLDWECARYTKEFAHLSAREFYEEKYKGEKGRFTKEEETIIEETLNYLGL